MDSSAEDKMKKLKEIADLESEIRKTKQLLQADPQNELPVHLQWMKQKYHLELSVYNMTHPILPRTTQENAQNCIPFLSALLEDKLAEIGGEN